MRAGPPDGIIVLGGAIMPEVSAAHGSTELTEAAERLTAAVQLARLYPQARIVFSGGNGELTGTSATEAQFGARLVESLGLPPGRVTVEVRGRDAAE